MAVPKSVYNHPDKLGAGAAKRKHLKGPAKVEAVMHEFKSGTLRSGSGEHVTNPKQAIAIAMSEAGMSKPAKKHGDEHMMRAAKRIMKNR